jgi:DNA-binding FadR family transcriptional regulator
MNDDTSKLLAGRRRSDVVYKTLLDRLYAGRYARYSRLPTERELTEEFQVSRPVVRNALAQLRDNGLIRSVQGSGSIVLYEYERGNGTSLGPVSIGDFQKCFEFRVLIEQEAAYLAAKRCDRRALEAIRQNIDLVERHVQRGEYRIGESFNFHRAIATASDNPFLVQALDSVQDFIGFKIYVTRSMSLNNPIERLAMINGEHSVILSHIEHRRCDEARELMRSHIERARDLFLGCLPLESGGTA